MNNQQFLSQNYAMIVDNLDDAVIAVDQHGIIEVFNPAAQNFTGRSDKKSLGQSLFKCFAHQETLCHLIRIVLRDGRSISDHETITLRGHDPKNKNRSV